MPKELKHLMAAEVKDELDRSPNLLVIGLRPMDSETNHALRSRMREQNAHLRVIQNRTSRHALDEARKGLSPLFVGQTALALSDDPETDFISVAKTLVEAARKKSVELRGGYVDGEVLDKAGFEALASSPDKPTLRAMLCGAILGPARGIAVSMQAVGGGLARCLQARIDESGEAGGDES
jgi:large subunit ribosomal protein L10